MEEDPKPAPATNPVLVNASQIRHREVLSRMVYHNQTPRQIALELGFNPQNIYRIINSPLFQAELQKELTLKRRMERDGVIQSVADAGVQKLHEAVTTGKLVYGNEEKVLDGREIVAIIHDSLDRTGHKPVNTTVEAHMDLGSMIIQAHKDAENAKADEAANVSAIDVQAEEVSNEPTTGEAGV